MEREAVIAAGFGFRADATPASLRDALARSGAGAVDLLAAPQDKADAPAFRDFAAKTGAPVVGIAAPDLQAQDTLTRSGASLAARGAGSAAEAAALAALAPGARLLGARVVSADRMATCALAEGEAR